MSKKIYLASKSPRRQELLSLMGYKYELIIKEIDETYPAELPFKEVASYLSKLKSAAFDNINNGLIITADTVVIIDNQLLGKPKDNEDAFKMLSFLNNKTHEVITGVSLRENEKITTFSQTTEVTFSDLSDEQLWYYILQHKPFDKAGSYGIQDWIGMIGVKEIKGSYTNVMGLPTERLAKELIRLGF